MTFDDIVEEILGQLSAWTASPDKVTSLGADISASATELTVGDASYISRGMIEIGDELMYVQSVAGSTNTLSLLPQGRGWRGTTATAHTFGDTVVVSPAVPRAVVKAEMNNQIRALFPNVFGVSRSTFTFNEVLKIGWGVPSDALAILDVRYRDNYGNWQRVRSWEVEFSADPTDFPTGTSLRIFGVPYLKTVEVVYATRPVPFTDSSTAFTTTGLAESAKDLIVLGTLIRLLPALDIGRLHIQRAEAAAIASTRQLDAATTISRDLQRRYAIRLGEERKSLNMQYPARIHFGR